jgi:peptidoglycan/xylan/chitin deacetylase (PgdA/CDA1 family)
MFRKYRNLIGKLISHFNHLKSISLAKRTIQLKSDVPFISFTFDDFPHSAFSVGAGILNKFNVRGSFYASFGMMGGKSELGDLFTEEDARELAKGGHEIGSHTFGHLNSWKTPGDIFEASIIKNQQAAARIIPEFALKTLSYPYTGPHPTIKKVAGKYFMCCRGGGQIPNIGKIDLNLLRSCFIDRWHRDDLEYFKRLIQRNAKEKGWLIFSTHDIATRPSAFGCSPEIFENIVKEAAISGAIILPICDVYSRIVSINGEG